MIPTETYLFFITNKNGHSYFVQNGIVKANLTPAWLPESPEGWLDTQLSFGRNSKYYGINRAFVNPLKFVGDGAIILRYLFYTGLGIEEDLRLNINKWNDETGIYETYCKVSIDLSKWDDDPATGVTVNLIESGLLEVVKANEGNTIEIPLDGSIPENLLVNLDGILFHGKYNYTATKTDFEVYSADRCLIVPCVYVNAEGDAIGIIKGDQSFDDIATSSIQSTLQNQSYSNYVYKSIAPIQIKPSGKLKFSLTINPLPPGLIEIYYITSKTARNAGGTTNTFPDAKRIYRNTSIDASQVYEIDLASTIDLAADEPLYLMIRIDALVLQHFTIHIEESQLAIEFDSQYKSTTTWAITWEDAFKYIVDKMSGGKYRGVSNLLHEKNNLVLTSGMALRNSTNDQGTPNAVLKTSLNDLFSSANAVLNVALGNEKENSIAGEHLFLEQKKYVFNPSSVWLPPGVAPDPFNPPAVYSLDLGEVSGLKISNADTYFFNNLKIGYPEQKYDEKQGNLEYNTTAQYSLPFLKITKGFELISKYRADSYGVEYTRYLTPGNNTANNASDNNVFILNVSRQSDGTYILRRDDYTSITGIVNPATAYNIEDLTPGRMVRAHANYIKSILHNRPSEYLTFLSSDKNKDLATTLNGVTIVEKQNIAVSDLGAPLFIPLIATFTTQVPLTFEQVMTGAANGHIHLTYNGVNIYGFPIEVSVKPTLNDAQEWKLLLSPMTDIKKMVDLEFTGLNSIEF